MYECIPTTRSKQGPYVPTHCNLRGTVNKSKEEKEKMGIRWKWFHDMKHICNTLPAIILCNQTFTSSQVNKRKLTIQVFSSDQIIIVYVYHNDPDNHKRNPHKWIR